MGSHKIKSLSTWSTSFWKIEGQDHKNGEKSSGTNADWCNGLVLRAPRMLHCSSRAMFAPLVNLKFARLHALLINQYQRWRDRNRRFYNPLPVLAMSDDAMAEDELTSRVRDVFFRWCTMYFFFSFVFETVLTRFSVFSNGGTNSRGDFVSVVDGPVGWKQ